MDYVICYRKNPGGIPDYEQSDSAGLDNWEKSHPDCTITHMFKADANIIDYDAQLKSEFLKRCEQYGFKPDAISLHYIDNKGNRYTLVGLRPQNTKYKFVIYNIYTGKRYKVSLSHFRSLAPVRPD